MKIRSILQSLAITSLFIPAISPGQNKIVGGTKAPADTYRWIVALANTKGGTLRDRQICEASLIAPQWVLTAAHCVEKRSPAGLKVAIGLDDLNDTSQAEIRGIRAIFIHPGFRNKDEILYNDIAILLLDEPVTTISPVPFTRKLNAVTPETAVRALGWGDTEVNPRFPSELRMVDLKTTSLKFANLAYGDATLDRRHLAAMAPGKDTCGGDSGGLLIDIDGESGNPLSVGVTSLGLFCVLKNKPGIYANVGNYTPMIDGFLAKTLMGEPSLSISRGHRFFSRAKGRHLR